MLAILLAWPVPLWLQRAQWPSRAPGPALVLWQAIGISGGMALVTAPLTWGLQPFGSGMLSATVELARVARSEGFVGILQDTRWHPLGLAAITLGVVLFGHLSLVLLHSAYRTHRQRKKHREFVEILSASLQEHEHGLTPNASGIATTRVLPTEHPLAYCLPAMNQPLTVVSRGLLDELSSQQLSAVLAHESAHLAQRHDLLRLAFQAWHKAAPWLPATGVAAQEVTELTEIMADEVTLKDHERSDLVTALTHTLKGESQAQDASTHVETKQPAGSRRINRLINPDVPMDSCRVSLVIVLAVLLVMVPAAVSLL